MSNKVYPCEGFDATRLARLDARIEQDIAAGHYDGAALCVTRAGRIAYRGVHGFAERSTGRRLGSDDVLVSMSIGKQFTNVHVLQRIENGELHLDMPAAELLPAFRDPQLRAITLSHLLTHTSGVLSAVPEVDPATLMSNERLCAHAAAVGPEFAPGACVNYSILAAHAVLAEVVRAADGGARSFARIIAEDLFQPLGMHETSLGPRADLLERLCPVIARYSEKGLFDPAQIQALGQVITLEGCEIAAGGYLTTLGDLQRFTQMLANDGELEGVRILSPRTIDYCARSQTGEMHNMLFDYTRELRGWSPWPANIGTGFFVRGQGLTPGPISNLCSANTICGWGAGSTCFWVDRDNGVGFSFLSTGLMEDSRHIQRLQRLGDIVMTSLTV